jgi:hypothetical protein
VSDPNEPKKMGDGWYRSEESTRVGLTFELRRIALRFRVRPLPVLLLAGVITAGIAFKFLRKPKVYSAGVVMALTEGSQAAGKSSIPFDQLKEYVYEILLPDDKLLALIEDRNLHRLRKTFGPQYALGELRGQFDLAIWKNSFVYYDPDSDYRARKSARIGIDVYDGDPELALLLARDLASIVITSHEEQRRLVAVALAHEADEVRRTLTRKLSELAAALSQKQAALTLANQQGDTAAAAGLATAIASLVEEEKSADDRLSVILKSPEAIADQFTAAGLGMRIEVVEERRPDRSEGSPMVMVMILLVVGTGALVGSALFLGAFDSRVHDIDDVMRLGLPVLGHVPGFAGDHVGSLRARGARRARVPWFLRWRSRR